ncbi:abortive infection system antitoxin AbiGi family protein [Nocardioides aquiterrae]|uniref:Uncharacterized protein n=1 Tax=Nocardioides aquiterrae TaxID=203799 RepID=A0ABP4EYA8_9ACTN
MPKAIEELLQRRTDLSTFLVHLTRAVQDGPTALDNLKSMLTNCVIEARTPFGQARFHDPHLFLSASQKVVCFTETPLEHAWMMIEDIAQDRQVKFEGYGIAVTKTTARKMGANPVWYSDFSRWGEPWPSAAVDKLIAQAVERAEIKAQAGSTYDEALSEEPIFQLTPYFEQMGPMQGGLRKEFWWEREWRKVGNFNMNLPSRIVAVLAPEGQHAHLKEYLQQEAPVWNGRPLLDPTWGLERMVVALARIRVDDMGPFPKLGPGY